MYVFIQHSTQVMALIQWGTAMGARMYCNESMNMLWHTLYKVYLDMCTYSISLLVPV